MGVLSGLWPWLVAGAVVIVAAALLVPRLVGGKRVDLESALRQKVTDLARFKVERLAYVIVKTYLAEGDRARQEAALKLFEDLEAKAGAGQINVHKVRKIDRDVAILDHKATLADADELLEKLENIVHDPDATRRRLRVR